MDKKTIQLLAKYQKAANEKMDAIVKTLTAEEWDRNLGGFFNSIHSVCSHIYVCDYIYLKERILKTRDFELAKDSFFAPEYTFKDVLFSTKEEYLAQRPEMDKRFTSLSEELTDKDLSLVMKFNDSRGNLQEKELGGSILHVFNHASFHRGMVSVYMEILGKENDFNSLLAYV